MGIFDFFRKNDMDLGVEEWNQTPGGILLDVRTVSEYNAGHVAGSILIPLDEIEKVSEHIPDKDTPLFVHCRSGSRSGKAVQILKQLGYTNIKNIGGVMSFHGSLEK